MMRQIKTPAPQEAQRGNGTFMSSFPKLFPATATMARTVSVVTPLLEPGKIDIILADPHLDPAAGMYVKPHVGYGDHAE